MQLADSERSVGQLKSKTSELEGERDTLNEKLRRGADAISQTSKLQAKLEGKLSKLESDKAAAEKEAADAKATAAGLEVCSPLRAAVVVFLESQRVSAPGSRASICPHIRCP